MKTAPTLTRSTHVSNQATECKRSQMVVAIEVRKPDETRPEWDQRVGITGVEGVGANPGGDARREERGIERLRPQ